MGQGKSGLEDKLAAQVHPSWCEYGHDTEDVRTAIGHVRQVLTDMGVEFGMANLSDNCGHCVQPLKGRMASEVDDSALCTRTLCKSRA